MAKVCIVCHKEVESGHKVEDSPVIIAIRTIKQKLNIAKNNDLVVMDGCMEAYQKKRGDFERSLGLHSVLAGLMLLFFIFLPLLTSGFSFMSLVLGIILAAVIMSFSLVNYFPKISGRNGGAITDVVRTAKHPATKKGKGKK